MIGRTSRTHIFVSYFDFCNIYLLDLLVYVLFILIKHIDFHFCNIVLPFLLDLLV